MLSVLQAQHAGCTDEKDRVTMRKAGLFPERCAVRIGLHVGRLECSIEQSIPHDHRLGEASEEVNAVLLKIDITLSRPVVWMPEVGGAAAAKWLEIEIPSKPVAKEERPAAAPARTGPRPSHPVERGPLAAAQREHY